MFCACENACSKASPSPARTFNIATSRIIAVSFLTPNAKLSGGAVVRLSVGLGVHCGQYRAFSPPSSQMCGALSELTKKNKEAASKKPSSGGYGYRGDFSRGNMGSNKKLVTTPVSAFDGQTENRLPVGQKWWHRGQCLTGKGCGCRVVELPGNVVLRFRRNRYVKDVVVAP